MRRTLLAPALLSLIALPSAAAPKRGGAGGKSAPACGAKILPLVEGNVWTYQNVEVAQNLQPEQAIIRQRPPAPRTFTITVKSIEAKGGDTVVTLEEKYSYHLTNPKDPAKPNIEDRVVTSTITCDATKFDISPDSYFFAVEPGGFGGMTIDKLDRKGTSWKLTKGTFGEDGWPEDLVIQWTRTAHEGSGAKYGKGKLEIERRFIPEEPETINTKAGSYKAEKLAVTTTGRVTLESPLSTDLKPYDLPADWTNRLWFVEGTGVVMSRSRFGHEYHLVDSQLK